MGLILARGWGEDAAEHGGDWTNVVKGRDSE
jgi:hypothetical protein